MASRRKQVLVGILLAGGVLAYGKSAHSIDIHRFFEERCGRCHGHSGAFARKTLKISGDTIVGIKSGEDVRETLVNHYGDLTERDILRLIETFKIQVTTGGVFERKCLICHDRAFELARLRLIARSDGLYGRYTGNVLNDFLLRHGRLDKDEVVKIYGMFLWQLGQSKLPNDPSENPVRE